MIYLLLSIVCSVSTVLFFKLFERYRVDTLTAIVVNYFTCVIVGAAMGNPIWTLPFYTYPWFLYAVLLGVLFISIFYAIATTTQQLGVSVSMVAAKLSVVIPVCFAILFQGDSITIWRLLGILISLCAVFLITYTPTSPSEKSAKKWWLPVVVFVGSGIIDTLLNTIQLRFIPPHRPEQILSVVFLLAASFGLLVLYWKKFQSAHKGSFKMASLRWGVILGIPNFFSMFFLLKAIAHYQSASFLFPVNNIAIALLAAVSSYLFFKEYINRIKLVGMLLAISAIVFLALN